MRRSLLALACMGVLAGCVTSSDATVDIATLQQEVMEAERAFAATMADRNHREFTRHIAPDAIFFNGEEPIRGKEAVAESWRSFFEGEQAPFSWEPDRVEVLESGSLALSTGPVRDPEGNVTGRFNSIWRLEAPGHWRVVFDKGSPVCRCGGMGGG